MPSSPYNARMNRSGHITGTLRRHLKSRAAASSGPACGIAVSAWLGMCRTAALAPSQVGFSCTSLSGWRTVERPGILTAATVCVAPG
jgi:hypothetical protein